MYAAQALPTIRFEALPTIRFDDMGGRTHELPAQTDCWPAPADLRADAPAPVIVSADEGGVTLIYACSDGAYRPLAQRREWLAEQQRDALVLALLPASTTGAMVGYVRGVAGSERPLPLLPARSEQRTWHMTQLSGYGWFLRPLSEEARVLRRELVNCDNGGLELLVGRYGWGHADVPPTRQGTCIAEVGGASLVITPGPEMPSAPKGWQVLAHIPPRPRFELDTPTRKVIAVGPEECKERSEGELLQQRWTWAICS